MNDRRNSDGGFYNCGDPNNLARDCNNNAGSYDNNDNYNRVVKDAGGSFGGGAGKCYNCGKFGHLLQ
ncbi:hypothetical protein V6N11_024412 [Hibiscus sabdariffa]|uniref:CCHC-type domain-containing protein n=1 Tax=Hibiscus sabdariffa TaxID=183260 RepID=A0ABR2NF10_9ROSI